MTFPSCANARLRVRLLGAALLGLGSVAAFAQQPASPWRPDKPVRLVVGFAAGGGSDAVARLVAPAIAAVLGQPVVVENKAGAGGALAADFVAKAPADGLTWLFAPSGHSTVAAMRKSLPFRPVADFAWVSTVTTYPMVVAVAPDSPLKSMADLVAAARARPGALSYSSVGIGTAHHLIGEWLGSEAGAPMMHVPFKGGSAAATEVMAGRVNVLIETMTLALPLVQSGQLRALGVTASAPVEALPNVPVVGGTVAGVQYESWLGIAMPAASPPAVVNTVNAAIRSVLADPHIRQRLADMGGQATPSSPEAFRSRVETDIARFNRIVTTAKIERE